MPRRLMRIEVGDRVLDCATVSAILAPDQPKLLKTDLSYQLQWDCCGAESVHLHSTVVAWRTGKIARQSRLCPSCTRAAGPGQPDYEPAPVAEAFPALLPAAWCTPAAAWPVPPSLRPLPRHPALADLRLPAARGAMDTAMPKPRRADRTRHADAAVQAAPSGAR